VSSNLPAPSAISTPIVIPAGRAVLWLGGAIVLALLLYYFIGVDQGATSVFGGDHHVHEYVHDSRHFLGFPCH
jgi:hypothetical protein